MQKLEATLALEKSTEYHQVLLRCRVCLRPHARAISKGQSESSFKAMVKNAFYPCGITRCPKCGAETVSDLLQLKPVEREKQDEMD